MELTGYKIIYQYLTEQGVLDETKVTITVERNTTNYTIAGLERNSTYCVRVLIYNELGDAEHNNCTKVTTSPGKVISFLEKERKVCKAAYSLQSSSILAIK